MTSVPRINCILLDIEGTTTPIAFVHEVLFPYARLLVRDYLVENLKSSEVLADVSGFYDEHVRDIENSSEPPVLHGGPHDVNLDSLVSYIHWLIDRDRKSTALKSLQGKIWKQGYDNGTLKSQVFEDVAPALDRWRRAGLKIGIFSSGSRLAQELLFAHTEAGDLTGFIDYYFDTTLGPKIRVQSYFDIASAIRLPPNEVLFISDATAELDAALIAGMKTLLSDRPGNPPPSPNQRHHIIRSFDEVL
jgi:enolase-phosphatase E1